MAALSHAWDHGPIALQARAVAHFHYLGDTALKSIKIDAMVEREAEVRFDAPLWLRLVTTAGMSGRTTVEIAAARRYAGRWKKAEAERMLRHPALARFRMTMVSAADRDEKCEECEA